MNRDLVVIGASAGGIEALKLICPSLPKSLNAAVLAVVHTAPRADGMIPWILDRAGVLHASYPSNGDPIELGKIYVAPPDHHMLVEEGHLRLYRGPRENRHCPAIDPTFRSAALSYGRRVIGIVLTGSLDDGTAGLMVVRAKRGVAVVQDPATAMFPAMPANALLRVPDAIVVPLEGIAGLIQKLVSERLEPAMASDNPGFYPNPGGVHANPGNPGVHANPGNPGAHTNPGNPGVHGNPGNGGNGGHKDRDPQIDLDPERGKPSQFACPECGGVLWEIDQQGQLRFRCRVGHAYTANYLQSEQSYAVETALWAALRALEETASLYQRMATRALEDNQSTTHAIFAQRVADAKTNAETLRKFLLTYGEKFKEAA